MQQAPGHEPFRARDIVAIGASAGGVEPLLKLLSGLSAGLPASVLIVMHRSVEHTSNLRQIIASRTKLRVTIPHQGQPLLHGVCYIGTPERHLTVGPGCRFRLIPDHFYRAHNIDMLFSSLAQHVGGRTIGVILSGLLKDGSFGLKAIKEAGGVALVQSPQEAKFRDMPDNAIKHDGAIDLIAPVDGLVAEILRLVGQSSTPAEEREWPNTARNQ